ncbi:MAG: glutamine synthetase [Elusimicrobia bacterium HGW-Elusimicrobia-1]|jgi:glutamine synthetase|nr:MAG: glutamine synthetase [Elusimicrobia bacterium HGW-Elusimicrobia-3]PKN01231.1 MAG: glutamine synthetase [Elusimicrobia bacterium HGW-Elusimicrobia-1]
MYTAEEVLKIVKEKNIKFINLWFVDILGKLKSFSITPRELEGAMAEGMGFDGSSIEGFARIFESDLIAKPDPATFTIMPWRPEGEGSARMICDILNPDGTPYEGDPRYILKKNLAELKKQGFGYFVGPELEYFYFKSDNAPEIIDEGGYFDTVPLDVARDLRRETILILEKMGIKVEYSHHEVAPSQHEIDLRYDEALKMADTVMTYKVVVKQVAYSKGLYASFMPKPLASVNGSGMHTHMSLFSGERNAFYEAKDKYHLSEMAKHFIAGVLKHVPEMCIVTNQWVNSYKRLVPGFEAPAYISWARRNRSALVRVPMYKPGKEMATRIELRFPDPACNPYLSFAIMLAAGLEGVRNKYPMPEPIEKDIFHLTEDEREKEGIKTLPGSLIEAIEAAEKSELLKKTLGDHVFGKLIENKKIEWDMYRTQVTEYEIKKYLAVL